MSAEYNQSIRNYISAKRKSCTTLFEFYPKAEKKLVNPQTSQIYYLLEAESAKEIINHFIAPIFDGRRGYETYPNLPLKMIKNEPMEMSYPNFSIKVEFFEEITWKFLMENKNGYNRYSPEEERGDKNKKLGKECLIFIVIHDFQKSINVTFDDKNNKRLMFNKSFK